MMKIIRLGIGIVLALFVVGFIVTHGVHGSITSIENLSKAVFHYIVHLTGKPKAMAGQ